MKITTTHKQFGQTVEQSITDYINQGGHNHCGEQCSSCCKQAVHTTFPEAQLIAPTLDENQKTALNTYIEKLHSQEINSAISKAACTSTSAP